MRELAQRVGIHQQSLRNIELGKRSASASTLESLAVELGIDVTQITNVSGNPNLAPTRHEPTSAETDAPAIAAEPAPSYRVFTSIEGARRIGGKVTANLLETLATQGFEHTRIGGKIHYTDAQLALVVAAHARGETAITAEQEPAQAPEPTPLPAGTPRRRTSRTVKTAPAVDLSATPGRRYTA